MRLFALAAVSTLALTACAAPAATSGAALSAAPQSAAAERSEAAFQADRDAILAMQGEYAVTFDFTETVPVAAGYELKEPKITPAREVVLVLEDEGDFISLQHLLLVGPEDSPVVIKHWRQDWAYEPERLMAYRGFQRWEMVDLDQDEVRGAWSQTVYQVDDSPRYAGIARWEHAAEGSTWEPARSWRPLPRRDATTRDDYDVIAAVNRHSVFPWGWTHEQDNSKLILRDGDPRELVREQGINTYVATDLPGDEAAREYMEETAAYWARVRDTWNTWEDTADWIVVQDDADGTQLYAPMLSEAQLIAFGEQDTEAAWAAAQALLDAQVETRTDG